MPDEGNLHFANRSQSWSRMLFSPETGRRIGKDEEEKRKRARREGRMKLHVN